MVSALLKEWGSYGEFAKWLKGIATSAETNVATKARIATAMLDMMRHGHEKNLIAAEMDEDSLTDDDLRAYMLGEFHGHRMAGQRDDDGGTPAANPVVG